MGTIVALTLCLGLIFAVIYNQKVRLKLQSEKRFLLEEGERKYSELFNNVSEIIYVHSFDGTIQNLNESGRKLLALSGNDYTGKTLQDVLPRKFKENIHSYLSLIKERAHEVSGLLPLFGTAYEGKILILEYRSSPVFDDGKIIAVRGIARDVTLQVRSERQLRHSRKRLENLLCESQVMQEKLGELSRNTIKFQESDRKRISTELHDEVGQSLTAITVNMEILKKHLDSNLPQEIFKRADESQIIARNVIEKVHDVLHELRPVSIDEIGILPTLRTYLNDFSERTGIEVSVVEDVSIEKLSSDQKITIYRIIQEATTNISRHSKASSVVLMIKMNGDNTIQIAISDNGCGFDVNMINKNVVNGKKQRLGIIGMQERMKLIGGNFQIESRKDVGTKIQIEIPLETR